MKKVFIFTFLLLFGCYSAFSQLSRNSDYVNARAYLSENILTIDPIEGIYDVENAIHASMGIYSQDLRQDFTWLIVREGEGVFAAYVLTPEGTGRAGTVERIGDTPYYKFIGNFGQNSTRKEMRFSLSSYYGFEISYSSSGSQGGTVNNHITAIREYPTRAELESAIAKKSAEQVATQAPTNWSGSGFALKGGFIVTNYHVVDGATKIMVRGINGDLRNSYGATVKAVDKNNDLAIIKISDPYFTGQINTPPYGVKTAVADVGEDVFILGYPLTAVMGDEIKYTTGVVSSKTGFQGDVTLYQISVPVQPGNSGGPLFDSKGNIIGVVNSKLSGAENVNYAIKTSYLAALAGNLSNDVLPVKNSISMLSRPDQIKRLGEFVYLIECESKKR